MVAKMTSGTVIDISTQSIVAAGRIADRITPEAAIMGKVTKAVAVRTATESIRTVERGTTIKILVMSIRSATGTGATGGERAARVNIVTGLTGRVPTIVTGANAS